jgi:ribosomal protein S27AE
MLVSTSVRTATAARIMKMKTNSFLRLDFFCPACSEAFVMGEFKKANK